MFRKLSQNGRVAYDIAEFIVDEKSDILKLPRCAMGSTVYIIRTKEKYMVDSIGTWYSMNSDGDPIECDCVEESTIWGDLKEE